VRALPECPVCRLPLQRTRAIGGGHVDEPAGSRLDVACSGCLSAIRLVTENVEDAPIDVTVLAPGAQITRLREELVAMRERDVLEPEIPALLADPVTGLLLGVPEMANEVLARGVRSVRIARNSYAYPAWYFTVWGEPPWYLDRWTDHIGEAEKKAAIRDGSFGGFIVQSHRLLILGLQKFTVVGFFEQKALLAAPRLPEPRLKDHPGFLASWDGLVPDRARRPL
jgi:hypothetical protein